MNCATHNTVAAVAYCRTCGKPLCAACARDVRGTKFCEQCLADRIGDALPPPPAPGAPVPGQPATTERLPSPGLAAVLGFIPGVGAMYNGQFMKGFVHVMAFVCMIWMADHFGPIMVPVFFAYFFYLVFDAYKTAHALELGQPVPDPFGFERMFGPTPQPRAANPGASSVVVSTSAAPAEPARYRNSVPTGAVILIVLGLIFLLEYGGLVRDWHRPLLANHPYRIRSLVVCPQMGSAGRGGWNLQLRSLQDALHHVAGDHGDPGRAVPDRQPARSGI